MALYDQIFRDDDDWDQKSVCGSCGCGPCACDDYDEESALALIDAEGYHALSQIDFIEFIEFTLGTGGL
jgi:hypothetical protein